MSELITFPDVEAVCVLALNGFLTDCHASTKIPNPRPAKLVRVIRTGGLRNNIGIETAYVSFEAWAPDTITAQELGARVRAFVATMPEYGFEVGGLVFNPDPDTTAPRYQFTAAFYLAAEYL